MVYFTLHCSNCVTKFGAVKDEKSVAKVEVTAYHHLNFLVLGDL